MVQRVHHNGSWRPSRGTKNVLNRVREGFEVPDGRHVWVVLTVEHYMEVRTELTVEPFVVTGTCRYMEHLDTWSAMGGHLESSLCGDDNWVGMMTAKNLMY
jgi:hypothetical protein